MPRRRASAGGATTPTRPAAPAARRAGAEVEARALARRQPARARGADHRPVVRAQPGPRDDEVHAEGGGPGGQPRAQGGIRRHAAAHDDRTGAGRLRGPQGLGRQDVHDALLEGRCQHRHPHAGEPAARLDRRLTGVRELRLDQPAKGRLEPREAEVVRGAHPGARQALRWADRVCRRCRDRRPTGVAESQEAPRLVERLAGGIVHGLAQEPVLEVIAHLHEERVAAGHDEGDEREGGLRLLGRVRVEQPGRVEMTLEVVDPDEGDVQGPRDRLRIREAHEERADQPRAGGDGHLPHVGKGRARFPQDLVERRVDPAQVGPRRDLGDDPAGASVQCHLARHGLGHDPAGPVEERDAGLVARRFDGQEEPAAHPGASGSGRAAISARSLASRAVIAGPSSGSVVMISASS